MLLDFSASCILTLYGFMSNKSQSWIDYCWIWLLWINMIRENEVNYKCFSPLERFLTWAQDLMFENIIWHAQIISIVVIIWTDVHGLSYIFKVIGMLRYIIIIYLHYEFEFQLDLNHLKIITTFLLIFLKARLR